MAVHSLSHPPTHPLTHSPTHKLLNTTHWCCAGGIWQQDAEATKSQLRGYLKSSGAVWKVVVGHHPIASFGSHCDFRMANDCQQMAWLEPELQVGLQINGMANHHGMASVVC
jgi:hypothetical protein